MTESPGNLSKRGPTPKAKPQVTHSKDNRHRREAELLGMPYGVAEKKLRLAVIHELARQLGKDVCCHCALRIESPNDIAIVHLQDWRDAPEQFWDLTNLTFSHASCEATRRPEGEKNGMPTQRHRRVVLKIEDENSNLLPGVSHEGTIHVAATEGERYKIRVKNTTGKRLLVVTTVDGRNIIDGEPGTVDGPGYILNPQQEHVFEGWRQTDSAVAAFRFGKKGESYSSQMGSPENVGIVGLAVFEEKEPPKPTLTVRDRIVPMPYPVPANPWVDPWAPWRPRPYWMFGDVQITSTSLGSTSNPLLTTHFSSGGSRTFGGSGATLSCSTENSERCEATMDAAVVGEQQLGTEYGETVASFVSKTTFERATESPVELWEVRYDSLASLQARGIMSEPPSRRPKAPAAFPAAPKVTPGYCPRPSKQTYR